MIRALAILMLALPAPDRAVTLAGGANQPQLAASEDGSFYAVFIKDGNIECAVSADKGKTWSKPAVAIDAKGKAKGGMQRGPRIAVDGKKTDQGRKIGKNGGLPGPLCECCAPGLTADAKGNPILIYREGGKSNRPLDLAMSTNGGASFARVTRINQGESKVDS